MRVKILEDNIFDVILQVQKLLQIRADFFYFGLISQAVQIS